MAEWILVMGCGAFAMAIAWLHDRRQVRKFITAFRKLEELLATRPRYREATEADVDLFAKLPAVTTTEADGGLQFVGDAVLEQSDAVEACRVFVDAKRTTLLYVQPAHTAAESYTAELSVETKTGKRWPWVLPPFKLLQSLSADASVSRVLAAHHEFVRGATEETLQRFETLADAIRAWEQISARTMAWRDSQEPDELLKKDLRMLVGPISERLWARFGAQLRAEIPRAQMRRRAT